MNIENPQQGGGRCGKGVSELTLVPSIPKGIDSDSKRIHMYLLNDCENLNGKYVRRNCEERSNC